MADAMTHLLERFLPGASLLIATMVGALAGSDAAGSIGGALGQHTSLGVVLPLAVVHAWTLWRPGCLPAIVVFCAGLLADALTAGPLGYWPLVYLSGLVLAHGTAARVPAPSMRTAWLLFAGFAFVCGVTAWTIASLYQFRLVGWQTLLWPVAAVAAGYPVPAWVVLWLARWIEGGEGFRGTAIE